MFSGLPFSLAAYSHNQLTLRLFDLTVASIRKKHFWNTKQVGSAAHFHLLRGSFSSVNLTLSSFSVTDGPGCRGPYTPA